ncbi:MAG: GtrA family protein [Bacteroidota bacterium]
MHKFLKAQLASLISTLVDFSFTFFMAEICHQYYLTAVALGAIVGAVVNFSINRYWSFNATDASVQNQGFKYALVWVGSLLLNLLGTYVLTQFFLVNYLLSKTITAVCVGLGFNYTLQKHYVFATKKNS